MSDPAVREWVSRFVDPDRPVAIGSQVLAERAAEISRAEWERAYPEEAAAERLEGGGPEVSAGSAGLGRRSSRGRRPQGQGSGRWMLALALMVLATSAAFLLGRWSGPAPRTASRGASLPAASSSAASPVPLAAPSLPSVVPARPDSSAPIPSQPVTQPPATPRPVVRLGIEVASFLDPERAREERGLVAERIQLPVQVLTAAEGGEMVYRVVAGSFGTRRRAERAATDLVDRGLIDQARVVRLPADSTLQRP